MKFIRDIINEKTQAAGSSNSSALRYPLKLRAEDRADVEPEEEVLNTELGDEQHDVSRVDDLQDDTADAMSADEPMAEQARELEETEAADSSVSERIDFSAIAGAFADAPADDADTDTDEAMIAVPQMRDEAVASITREPSIFDAFDQDDGEEGIDENSIGEEFEDEFEEEIEAKLDREFGIAADEDAASDDGVDEDSQDQDDPGMALPSETSTDPADDRTTAEALLRRNIMRSEVQSKPIGAPRRDLGLNQPRPVTPEPMARTEPEATPEPMRSAPVSVSVPKPASGRGSGRSGRVKTRLLGFSATQSSVQDPISASGAPGVSDYSEFPVGWLVVVEGPGKGAAFTLFDGLTQIGRGEGQAVRLDFGDNSISRENHAAIAFDAEQGRFFFGHGGKANLVRLNGRPVLSTEDLQSGSVIRIGETTLRFIALCNEEFSWGAEDREEMRHAQHG
ncbi:FHA domain-containing protein [Shimia biformata]|uniref:FHA domain-containing protein n=1 Tax=Shimia biformata TaxID=1294299 RepID=UPI001EF31DCA|nr:FHA domain-containing protein [Shimia biformata]